MSGNFSLNGVLMDIAGAAISKAGSTRKEIPRCSQKPDAVTATVLAGFLLVFVATACCSSPVLANDLLRTTSGAAALGSGGVSLLATDPLAAMSNNPALL
ncbi:MAG: hypothetical protein KDI29_02575, partial [Pseudomonadales bacterium]|nr:hypothetical protein [Pseudomonadales bacterium]